MFKKRKTKELEKAFSKYLSKDAISEMTEIFQKTEPSDIMDELNKKEELKTYEIIVLYTKETDIQIWLETAIPKLMANNYIISTFFGIFLFAYRNCENGFDESAIKDVLSDHTKIALFIKKTKTIYIGTNERFCINPEISFNDDFLNLFSDLDYGKYMLITDDNG